MNDIINPITSDGNVGYDAHGQFWIYRYDPRDSARRIGSIYADLRGKSCLLCGEAWKTEANDLADQIHLRNAETHVHKSCYERHLTLLDRVQWVECLYKSGLADMMTSLTPVPNQYGGAWNTPWYKITLKGGNTPTMTFGARKRVDSIHVERITHSQAVAMEAAFAAEETTKGREGQDGYMIHSWGKEKTIGYFTKMCEIMTATAIPDRPKDHTVHELKLNKPAAPPEAKAETAAEPANA